MQPQQQIGVFNHARQLGGNDLQGLDVVPGEIVPLRILHRDYAHRIHLAQDGNRQKRNKLLLPASRNVLVVRIVRPLGLADRPHLLQRGSGDALAGLQPEPSDQARVQSLVGAHNQLLGFGFVQEDRAGRRPHVPGHGGHRLGQERIEPGLEIKQADQLADVAHQRHFVFLKIAHLPFIPSRARRRKWQGLTSFPKKVPSSAFRLSLLPDGVTVAQQPLELFV